jgi:hypothetical protein
MTTNRETSRYDAIGATARARRLILSDDPLKDLLVQAEAKCSFKSDGRNHNGFGSISRRCIPTL